MRPPWPQPFPGPGTGGSQGAGAFGLPRSPTGTEGTVLRDRRRGGPGGAVCTETRDSYLERLEAEIRPWAERLEAIRTRIDRTPRADRELLLEQLQTLRVKRAAFEESVRALKGTGEEVWETLRQRAERTLEEVTRDIEALAAKLR